ncbi:uncharacterized protein MONBRDRAFT_28659 [Monosiga brevicollis MX1]|uniref:Purple acid phosphatase n=1 Tax=Monosiga brevicollis TaxID=81824 RepID=A9V8T6_MONBE|nr:uncharacterized protein MONBRDRAFT_28659 [Monosiga brevicollis MX1]EDQ86017.1 predicted protein [Monosiga brevicollis MX1]|eukprot:XP_001749211.1 hypothetical protein [Monosiga brevicollis MX1]
MALSRSLSWLLCLVAVIGSSLVAGHVFTAPNALHLFQPNRVELQPDSDFAVSVNLTSLQRHGEFCEISVTSAKPNKNDFVALYLTSDDVTATTPIKYQFLNYDPAYLSSGRSKLVFQLLNMRENFVLHAFTGGPDHPTLVASSTPITNTIANVPTQGRLALTNDEASVRVSWTTGKVEQPQLQYGVSETNYTVVPPTATPYTRAQMCGAPANTIGWRDPGILYTAVMTNLAPNTHVVYRYGDAATDTFSPWRSLRTRPQTGDAFNMIAFGDLGQHVIDHSLQQEDMPASRNTTDGIIGELADKSLLFHNGDISYARGYESQWEEFHDQIEPIATTLPYMTAIGNHERDWPNTTSAMHGTDSGGECGVAYETRFLMPTPTLDDVWYSFDFGVMHLVVISTEHNFSVGSPQYEFVKKDLDQVNRKNTPWLVFAGHRPFYIDSTANSTYDADQPVAKAQRDTFEDMLYEHQVDMIWGAHHHSYQRSCPVYRGKCGDTSDGYAGPVVVNLGMAGAGNSQNLEPNPSKMWQVLDDTHHGYMRFAFTSTEVRGEYIRGDDLQAHDSFSLSK